MNENDLWTIATAAVCNVACALVGCLLVLRRLSLIGDAISHAVLPGIVVAYLLGAGLNPTMLMLAAAASGVLVAWITERLQSLGRVAEDASLGIAFTTLFALGVVLINRFASDVDLDPSCVLFGALELVEFSTVEVYVPLVGWSWHAPLQFVQLSLGLFAVVVGLALLWKEWKMAAFDPSLMATCGLSPKLLYYVLAALTAGVSATAFSSVGSILVVAMLVAPPAAARLLTDSYCGTFLIAATIGIATAFIGFWAAVRANVNAAAMMAVVAAGFVALAVLFAPRQGLIMRAFRTARLRLQVARQDVLARLFRLEEDGTHTVARPAPGFVLWTLARTGDAERAADGWRLTAHGRRQAQSLVRAHRLWEAYMDRHFALPADHLHEPAHRLEHFLDAAIQESLARELETPAVDPHGRRIPDAPEPPVPAEKPGGETSSTAAG